ncbi:class II aldolase/adducin family protein [Bradyrhizobium huanghuaihaiense]|uniref:class II aldolase/adducin family protein n=1 Tax=Bradyrhizobium huanghuaihaiense TaxID=990078 RepID=UPI0021AA6E75|nr:class II aldolase/adducin family protein [Bradyrhizobium sp. CB3035]UWU75853.1 class II aldolase/adducin family protein [Bradyrhizobium sp. CB3035]
MLIQKSKDISDTAETASHHTAEWQARVDLAAAHRLAVIQGFSEGIFNHFTVAMPGKSDGFLSIPFGLHWSEVTASSLIEVSYDGTVLSGQGDIEMTAFCIHAPVHRLNPKARAALHTHMPYASALTRLKDSRIKAIGQTEILCMKDIAYDEHYPGGANDIKEGERLAGILGDKSVLFMGNHGVLVVGETVAEAYDRLYYLERACQVQLYAMWTHQELRQVDPLVVKDMTESSARSYIFGNPKPDRKACEVHFDALKRMLERRETPDYRN